MAAPSLTRLRWLLFPCAIGLGLTLTHPAHAARKICVDVVQKSWDPEKPHGNPRQKDAKPKQAQDTEDKAASAPEPPAATDPPGAASPAKDPAAPPTEEPAPAPLIGPRVDEAASERPWSQELGPKRATKPEPGEDTLEVSTFDAPAYLRRMLEYEVTHDPNYEAVQKGCGHRITVELYPLKDGWTVFARYSGYAREEKVDYVTADEFAQLAQRLARALLYDRPISDTITRENVLRADSEQRLRTVGVRGHALFGMGTALRMGKLPTATDDGTTANDELRLLTPITLALGYRGKLKAWGLDAQGRVNLGTRERAAS
ncbi:MAG: hypothetical protein KC492_41280, partial [Myxococcales bacterium]|nr:hypothetical protein [Myxococcales bacterium]